MPSTINTNISSLNAQRQLSHSQGQLATSMARLSSGLRVNSAKDDAAGLAIAERMNAQVRGMNVAMRNANDGISLAQTAEGALGQVGNALQRMRELALQARNATNSTSDKDSLDKEYGELAKEVQRVLGGTTFNGLAILGQDAGTLTFQVGAGVTTNDSIDVGLTDLTANAALLSVTSSGGSTPTAPQLAAANLAVKTQGSASLNASGNSADAVNLSAGYADASSAAEAVVNAITASRNGLGPPSEIPAFTNGVAAATSAADAAAIVRTNILGEGIPSSFADAYASFASTVYQAFSSEAPTGASIGGSTDAGAIATVVGNLDSAINVINDQRASFGASLSRFESVIATLQVSAENQSAARSRIMDADFASETANLSRAQILQQAGNAMVAQANQLPQQVLSLLG